MTDFAPLNSFEIALDRAKSDLIPMSEFIRTFVDSELVVPSGAEVMSDGSGFQPLLFKKEQAQMVGCFSEKQRIGEYTEMTPYYLTMKGRDLLRRLPPSYGIVINPGCSLGFDISPDGVARIVSELSN